MMSGEDTVTCRSKTAGEQQKKIYLHSGVPLDAATQ